MDRDCGRELIQNLLDRLIAGYQLQYALAIHFQRLGFLGAAQRFLRGLVGQFQFDGFD